MMSSFFFLPSVFHLHFSYIYYFYSLFLHYSFFIYIYFCFIYIYFFFLLCCVLRVGGVSFAVGTKEPERYGGGYMGGGGSSYKPYNPDRGDSSYSRDLSSSTSGGSNNGSSSNSVSAGGGGVGAVKKQGGTDRLSMIRNEVLETNRARARGDLTGDLDYYNRNNNGSSNNRNSQYGGGGGGGHDLFRPLRTTVAYDSDLDMESSDEDN